MNEKKISYPGQPMTVEAFPASTFLIPGIQVQQQAEVPEPLTILGSLTALGFGRLFKRKLSKKQKPEFSIVVNPKIWFLKRKC